MKIIKKGVLSLSVIFGVAIASSLSQADSVSINIKYTEVDTGVSLGLGVIEIDDSILTPNQSIFDQGDFLSGFNLSFSDIFFSGNDTIEFTLSDIQTAYLETDNSGNIIEINFWTYDRKNSPSLDPNQCETCSEIYLSGISPFTATLNNPASSASLTYNIELASAIPLPPAMLLFSSCLMGVFGIKRYFSKYYQPNK